jgi:hypothetical protein
MKHTPGPWEIVQSDHGIVVRTESPKKTRYGASRYAAIGGFERSDPQQLAEALANARLIAAAPELLEALQILFERANRNSIDPFALQQAVAAIVKATGKTK